MNRSNQEKNERKHRPNPLQERNKFPSIPAPKSKDFSVGFITRSSAFRSRVDRFPIRIQHYQWALFDEEKGHQESGSGSSAGLRKG
uniref:Uncharacterized protein n=1 Tax=Solanum tuberosum TaxID=4113 RepID=M1DKQ5_SOLTU